MRKLYDAGLELRLIKAVCATQYKKASPLLLSKLNENHFASEAAGMCFNRVKKLLSSRGKIPKYIDLKEDPALPKEVRQALTGRGKSSVKTEEDVDTIFRSADQYRKMRMLNELSRKINRSLNEDDEEVDDIVRNVSEDVANIHLADNNIDVVNIGTDDNAEERVKQLLEGTALRYIPTGFNAFDGKNRGLSLGSLLLVAATTGGGKSAVIRSMATNMAMSGAKVALVNLEMDNNEVLQRELSSMSGIEMGKFLDPENRLSTKEKSRILKTYRNNRKKIRKVGGKVSYFSAGEDVNIDNLLAVLKPQGYDAIIIDYVGLLEGADGDNQHKVLSAITRKCKVFGATTGTVMIVAAQLSDDGIVRYSRAMQEHASNMWSWTYTAQSKETKTLYITQPKARNQSGHSFYLHFNPDIMLVRDLTKEELAEIESVDKGESSDDKKKYKGAKDKKKKRDFFEEL